MPITNAEKQANHRAKKDGVFEKISFELAKISEENRIFRDKIEILEKKIASLVSTHAKKISSLEKRLLTALESNKL